MMGAPLDPEIPSWVTDGPPPADIEDYLDVRKKATAAKQAEATTGSAPEPEPQPQPQPRPVITVRGGGLSDEGECRRARNRLRRRAYISARPITRAARNRGSRRRARSAN